MSAVFSCDECRMAKQTRKYVKVSVPLADKTVLRWLADQDDMSSSIRYLIREDVIRNGYGDVRCREIVSTTRRPRVSHGSADLSEEKFSAEKLSGEKLSEAKASDGTVPDVKVPDVKLSESEEKQVERIVRPKRESLEPEVPVVRKPEPSVKAKPVPKPAVPVMSAVNSKGSDEDDVDVMDLLRLGSPVGQPSVSVEDSSGDEAQDPASLLNY